MALEESDKLERLAATGARLRTDGGIAEAVGALERAGLHPVLLKGPSIARWLYGDGGHRDYADCDLLVGPEEVDAAEQALRSLGYEPLLDQWGLPTWWYGHATVWQRRADGVCVDLHRTLIGVGVDNATAWSVLSAEAEEVVVAAHHVPCLSLPARALYVALHAAQHGPGTQPAVDLGRAVDQVDDELWLRAARLAARLDASEAFVAGLRIVPAGARLVTGLMLPEARSVTAELRASTPPPLALAFEQLARAPGTRARVRIVWRNLAPRPALLRRSDPGVARSRWALVLAYLRRTVWLARRAPRGFQAWYRVHRSVRHGRR